MESGQKPCAGRRKRSLTQKHHRAWVIARNWGLAPAFVQLVRRALLSQLSALAAQVSSAELVLPGLLLEESLRVYT